VAKKKIERKKVGEKVNSQNVVCIKSTPIDLYIGIGWRCECETVVSGIELLNSYSIISIIPWICTLTLQR